MISLNDKVSPFRNEKVGQSVSSQDKESVLKGKDLGEVLNKVADPNFKSKSNRVKGHGNPNLDKDAFIKLFLAQVKNQDPLSPVKNHEMAAQLAQFASLEKLENIRGGIDQLSKNESIGQQFTTLSLIGKEVETDSSRLLKQNENDKSNISFSIPKHAKSVKIKIFDEKGGVVNEMGRSDLKPGYHEIEWDGENQLGQKALAGEYKVSFEALDNLGKKILVDTKQKGKVSGVHFSATGPVLVVGSNKIKLSDVKSFTNPEDKKSVLSPSAHPSTLQEALLAKSRQPSQGEEIK
jgi:flagellar basal-body rod modification protein FlgD